MYAEIRYEVEDPVATITLCRPESLNAWTTRMDGEVRDAVDRATADPAVVGIVITGEGRAFCAGADMNVLDGIAGDTSGDALAEVLRDATSVPETLRGATPGPDVGDDFSGRFAYLMTTPKPIVAAINGAVSGLAFPFALSCDLRVACRESLFITSFAQRGLIAEWGLGWLLPQLVGPSVALDLLFSSRRVAGEEAHRLGLANYLVERAELLTFSRAYIEGLARTCSPSSLAVMKRQVYEHLHRGLGAAEAQARELMVESFSHPDFVEGVSSFLEKRPPEFRRLP
jgi:enoyl-CoA hydratase/carnithine racemase